MKIPIATLRERIILPIHYNTNYFAVKFSEATVCNSFFLHWVFIKLNKLFKITPEWKRKIDTVKMCLGPPFHPNSSLIALDLLKKFQTLIQVLQSKIFLKWNYSVSMRIYFTFLSLFHCITDKLQNHLFANFFLLIYTQHLIFHVCIVYFFLFHPATFCHWS